MAVPSIDQTYPADSDVGIPVGATLLVYFDNVVDLQTVKDSLILHGPDFDFQTGPGGTDFISEDAARNPYFLSSPGFTGVAPLAIELAYYTLGTTTEVVPDAADTLDEAAALAANIGHVAKVTLNPDFNALLAGDTQYTFTIVGDPDTEDVGVSTQTIYAVQETAVAGDGGVVATGTWTGAGTDVIHVKITKAGDINVAKYKWWYDSSGEGSAVTGRIVSNRFRLLDDGASIRFVDDGFLVDDEWEFNVEAIERLATNQRVVFTTNDGTYTAAPASPSTPAPSLPPATVLPGVSIDGALEIVSMTPVDGSYNNANVNEIVIVFNRNPDPASITADTLKLWTYPVEGLYQYEVEQRPLAYTYTLVDNILTIRI